MESHLHTHDLTFFIRPRSSDSSIVHEVIDKDVYEKYYTIQGHDVVVDIGAHIGSFSILAASKGANVYAFEPVAENFALLEKNIAQNGFGVHAFNTAVRGVDVPTDTIYVRAFNYGGSNLYCGPREGFTPQEVSCQTLDAICDQHHLDTIHFLKLDCEGAEDEILKGCHVLDRIQHLAIEYHFLVRRDTIINLLQPTHHILFADTEDMGFLYATHR